jgi:hypothetical protein
LAGARQVMQRKRHDRAEQAQRDEHLDGLLTADRRDVERKRRREDRDARERKLNRPSVCTRTRRSSRRL